MTRVGGIENAWHIFVYCPYAFDCWREAGLLDYVQTVANSVDSLSPWLFQIFAGASEFNRGKIAMVLWGLWRHRNDKRWNNIE